MFTFLEENQMWCTWNFGEEHESSQGIHCHGFKCSFSGLALRFVPFSLVNRKSQTRIGS